MPILLLCVSIALGVVAQMLFKSFAMMPKPEGQALFWFFLNPKLIGGLGQSVRGPSHGGHILRFCGGPEPYFFWGKPDRLQSLGQCPDSGRGGVDVAKIMP
jgi:hypothetical protein